MDIKDYISLQLAKEQTYENEKAELEQQIRKAKNKLNNLRFPHWHKMLSEIITDLNEVIKVRGFQFETEYFYSFGNDSQLLVYQSYANSDKFTYAYLAVSFENGKLWITFEDDRKIEATKLEDFLFAIDEMDHKHTKKTENLLKEMSIDELKAKVLKGELPFSELPENEQTEETLIQYANCDNAGWEYIPAAMISRKVLKHILLKLINNTQKLAYPKIWMIKLFEYQRILDMLDKELFTLALKAGIRLFSRTPYKKLCELEAFDDNTIMLAIERDIEAILFIPENKMKDDYIIQFSKLHKLDGGIDWNRIKGLDQISQETAKILVENQPKKVFPILAEKYKTLELCHTALKHGGKTMKKYIPSKHLSPTESIQRLSKH